MRKLLQTVNRDLPVCKEPFLEIAGSKEKEKALLKKIKELKSKKIITKYSAKLNQEKAGYLNNALVVWVVPEKRADNCASIMVKYTEVSHCYLRRKTREFPYSLYTMIHAKTKKQLDKLVKDISNKTGLTDYLVLKTLKEFKKTKQVV
ncbi:MAG: Lrp/AsnC family transcriptional regulator [Armatimonadota bacterium]